MRSAVFVFVAALTVFAITHSLQAEGAVPKLINYQGKLTNAGGVALEDGQYSVRFELFDAATAGTLVWGEVRSVTLIGGIFNVALGGAGSLLVNGAAVNDFGFAFGGAERYLQTTIVSGPSVSIEQPLLPRQQMTSVPFALRALHEVPAGTVVPFAGSVIPDGWALCDGSTLDGSDPRFARLFIAIQTTYGAGSGLEFSLPDLRGRAPIGAGQGDTNEAGQSPTDWGLAQKTGTETHTLTVAEMPAHSHTVQMGNNTAGGPDIWVQHSDTQGGNFGTHTTSSSGSGVPHRLMQPSLVLNYIIKL